MKKARFIILCGLAALMLLSACAGGTPKNASTPEPTPTNTPGITPEPGPTPSMLTNGELFYQYGEELVSIAQLEERFGELTDCYASYWAGTDEVVLNLHWYVPGSMRASSSVEVQLFSKDGDMSFLEELSEGDGLFVTPSDEDRQIPLEYRHMYWSRAAIRNPRGIRIGMTQEEIEEVYTELGYLEYDMSMYPEGYLESNPLTPDSALYALPMPADALVTLYDQVVPREIPEYYEYAIFYLKDGVLVSMAQGCTGRTFVP